MENRQFNLAMVGYGGIAHWHKDLIKSGIDGLNLAGIYDINPKQCEDARSENIHAYDSYEDLLNDEKVDIVLVATPNDLHKPLSIKALKAGKNVVCEKPVCLNSTELQEIFDVAQECERLFVVHQNRRWDADFRIIKEIYDSKTLGNVYSIESRIHGSRGIPGDWRNSPEHGGGMMLDWGVHIIDQILWMIDQKVKKVFCTFDHITNDLVDDGFKLLLTFQSGLTVHLEVGTSNFIELPRWYMLGDNGSAVINDWNNDGKIVKISDRTKNDATPVKTAAGLTKTMAPRTDETIVTEELPKQNPDIKDFYRNVMANIKGEEPIIVKHCELMRVMKLMEAAFKSASLELPIYFEQ